MSKRTHNVYFHLHTISGITISVALFIIFFAGSYSLFVDAIEHWEKGDNITAFVENKPAVDYNRLIDSLESKGIHLFGRNINTTDKGSLYQSVYLTGSEDSLAGELDQQPINLVLNTETYELKKVTPFFSLGDLLYELHFFNQLGKPGYYFSALVSLFFLFAIISGIIVHWKKIKMNFSVFRPKQKLKTIWTDAHTALGTIGLPFQFMYALTGAMFGLSILVSLSGSLMFGGNTEKFNKALEDDHEEVHTHLGSPTDVSQMDYNAFRDKADQHWPGFKGMYLGIMHYGSNTQQFRSYGYVSVKDQFLNEGEVVFDMGTGKVLHEHDPYDRDYTDNIWPTVYRLHFANYGNIGVLSEYLLKALYFLMAILTCFVIISGVLIWLEARKKLTISERKKYYNKQVGHIYLAICMSMLPITAAAFICSKLLPVSVNDHREITLNCFYFISWLLLSLFFWYKQDNGITNRYSLLSAGILGLAIPVVNGFISKNWFWLTYSRHDYGIFIIDILWMAIALSCLYAYFRMTRKHRLHISE